MSKLLKEATIRRFMALANIETLSDGFVNEGSYGGNMGDESESHRDYMKEEEDELEATEDELGAEDEMADMEGDEVDDLEADMGAEGGDVTEEDVVDIVATIADALEDKYGIAVDVEGGDMGGDELEATEDELGAEDEMADMEGDEVDDLEADMDVEMVDDEEVVAEVLKRVSARLREAVKKSKRSKITRK
tara:strand:+ start:4615 stop:5187 length:573 start_codon:yes stop_codon:yes gene_type:complete